MSMELSSSGVSKRVREQATTATTTTTTTAWTARKVITFFLLSFVFLLTWCCFSLWATFLPIEGKKRGVTSTEVGFIYGTYSLVSFLAAFLYGPILIPKIGPYFVLFAGLFINAGANIICGYIELIQDRNLFAIYCFIVRAVGALGGAGCETSVLVIVTDEFRDNLAIAIGMLRVFTGLGFLMGPLLGGILYTAGGFRLPLFVVGGALMAAFPLVWIFLPRKETYTDNTRRTGRSSVTLQRAFSVPGIVVICGAYFIGVFTIAFLEPTLQPFAAKLGVSPTGVGLLFLCLSGFYMVSTPILGYIIDRKPWKRTVILIGAFGIAVGLLLLGPAPFLSSIIPRKVWIITFSLSFSGIAFAMFYLPILPELLDCCYEKGFPRDIHTDSLVSGLYTGFSNLGAFVGPALGGMLTGSVGFPWSVTILAFITFAKIIGFALPKVEFRSINE